jgi:hypothetical protein
MPFFSAKPRFVELMNLLREAASGEVCSPPRMKLGLIRLNRPVHDMLLISLGDLKNVIRATLDNKRFIYLQNFSN